MIDLRQISQERLMDHLRSLTRWTRLSGTAEELEAARYVEGELAKIGYRARVVMHDAYISLPGAASLKVTAPAERDLACITHSMVASTPEGGVRAHLLDAGTGAYADLERAAREGGVALVQGRATPDLAATATRAGVPAVICISGRIPHEMCCSPVWGNPSAETVGQLPAVPVLSVSREDGEWLRDLCRAGWVEVHLTAQVQTGWTQTPLVLAELPAGHPDAEPGKFVLFSGHLDSWYVGAMDNGGANAAMIETARLLAGTRDRWRRGLRLAFWSGHSHGRYSSSAWYADQHWFDLDRNCVAHVNIDSIGGMGADYFQTNAMAETFDLCRWAVAEAVGAELRMKRVARNSDQSFCGIGIPALLGSVSRNPEQTPDLGWWWHTPEDTLDKIDPDRLVRDTGVFVRAIERLLTDPVLPLDYAASADDIAANLAALSEAAGGRFDLGPALAAAERLGQACRRLNEVARATGPGPDSVAVNAVLQDLGRILIPATYTAAGRHGHDPALDRGFLPGLQPVRRLADPDLDAGAARFLKVGLVRARNALVDALERAAGRVEAFLAGRPGHVDRAS
ncbi:MAG TPA: M28 family peptidase [Bacillota bacterium]